MEPANGTEKQTRSVVIPKEKAVFWMDGQGRWRNRHGVFAHKGIIDHFNASIRKDAGGFFVAQERSGIIEKVYFRFEETAVFAVDVIWKDGIFLCLNTGSQTDLVPDKLFVYRDNLFQKDTEYAVKFSERALMKISPHLKCQGDVFVISCNGVDHLIKSYDTFPDAT